MFVSNGKQCLVVSLPISNERAISFDDDAFIIAVFDDLTLLAPRMKLDITLVGIIIA